MAIDERKRQKKLAKQRAKHKAKHKEFIRRKNMSLAERMARASAAPLEACLFGGSPDQGLVQVMVSRRLADGRFAVAGFLVDTYCLGVKNAFADVFTLEEHRNLLESMERCDELEEASLADACKLVEQAVAYAAALRLPPHPNYFKARPIFGDARPEQSRRQFRFGGPEGKPLYIAGPYDPLQRQRRVIARLKEAVGPKGFGFIAGGDGAQVHFGVNALAPEGTIAVLL